MAQFILKDSKGKEQTFDHETIYVRDTNGELVQFTQGTGTSTDIRYVTFMSYDGSVEYGKKAVAVGDDCADPIARGVFGTPTRESDAQYDYTFYSWATEPNGGADANWNKAINEDKTVYANFATSYIYYTVTFYDDDNTTVLNTKSVTYGADASYTPEKAGYKFMGWSADVTNVTSDMAVYATWQVDDGYIHDSWETVVANITAGTGAEHYSVGDKIVLPLTYADGTTEEVDLYLACFDDGLLADGTVPKAAFVCAEVLRDLCALNTSKLASGSKWAKTTLYSHLMNTVFTAMPSVLQNNIKARSPAVFGSDGFWGTDGHKLWLITEGGVLNNGGARCIPLKAFYGTEEQRILCKRGSAEPVEWTLDEGWSTNGYYYAVKVGTDGVITDDKYTTTPSTPRGVVFGFCI